MPLGLAPQVSSARSFDDTLVDELSSVCVSLFTFAHCHINGPHGEAHCYAVIIYLGVWSICTDMLAGFILFCVSMMHWMEIKRMLRYLPLLYATSRLTCNPLVGLVRAPI